METGMLGGAEKNEWLCEAVDSIELKLGEK